MDTRRVRVWSATLGVLLFSIPPTAIPAEPPDPVTRTDYDEGDWYLARGDQKLPYHGMRDSWVFNRAMTWLDKTSGVDGAVLCYSTQSPLHCRKTAIILQVPLDAASKVQVYCTSRAGLLHFI